MNENRQSKGECQDLDIRFLVAGWWRGTDFDTDFTDCMDKTGKREVAN
jgi:hypothetical protein